jgi:hypothetical protein
MSGELIPRLGASVSIAPGIRWTGTGLEIDYVVTGDTWTVLVHRLLDVHDKTKWAIADALIWGESHRPEEFGQVFDRETFGDRYEQISSWMRVAKRIPPERRKPSLSWSAHRAVSHLEPDKRDRWLDRAEAEGWRSNELEAEVRGHRQSRREQIEEAAVKVWLASSINVTKDSYVTPVEVMQALGALLDGREP